MNKRPLVALFLFNATEYAVAPWLRDGRYTCVSVDYDNSDHAGDHRKHRDGNAHHVRLNIDLSKRPYLALCEVFNQLQALDIGLPDFVMSFAPCTDLAVCGNKSRPAKLLADPNCIKNAVAMARLAEGFGCPFVVENPVSILASEWRKPNGYVHPWMFADQCPSGPHPEFPDIIPPYDLYNKKTALWCGNGAQMPRATWHHKPPIHEFPGYTKLGGKSARTKYIRSLTPRGMAQAIYSANKTAV
jgi:hypothetical protein